MHFMRRVTNSTAVLVLASLSGPVFSQCTRCGPAVSVSPTKLVFSSQRIGTRSAPKIITVKNTLPIPARIGVTTTGPFQSTGCVGLLGGHKSCTINVTFAPLASGLATGATNITDGTPAGHFKVQLSGTGVR